MKRGMTVAVGALCLSGLFLSGCVLNEKYEAEKARAVNFQRLLAQEEKRTGELDSELKRVRQEANELEARNREVSAQLQAVREQFAKSQEEAAALREALAVKQQDEMGKKAKREDKGMEKGGLGFGEPLFQKPTTSALEGGAPLYHEVKPGETLFRLSRQYGVNVDTIKQWNNLQDDLIEVGQQLIVGYQ